MKLTEAAGRIQDFVHRRHDFWFWGVLAAVLYAAFFFVWDMQLVSDEGFHAHQIAAFLNGRFKVAGYLTVLPVYHAVIAAILWIFGGDSAPAMRMVSFLGATGSIVAFYLLVMRVGCSNPRFRTTQFVFLPILFPFFFLVYTDVWSLGLVLVSVERALARKPLVSCLAATGAILLRTPNIIWAVFPWLIILQSNNYSNYRLRTIIGRACHRTWPFLILFGCFAVFTILNRGVAIGDRGHHPISLNFANVWFFGLLFFLLFCPSSFGALPTLIHAFRCRPLICVITLAAAYAFFLKTYIVAHEYNTKASWFYLRNRMLYWTSDRSLCKTMTFFPVILGLSGFLLSIRKSFDRVVLVSITIFSVLLFSLIEPRYYLVPLSLFLAFRQQGSSLTEHGNLLLHFGFTIWLLVAIHERWFFP